MREFSFDRLASVVPQRTGMAAMSLLTRMQDFTPEEQAAAAAVVFLLLIRKYGAHAGNVLAVGENIIGRALETNPELRAVFGYVQNEV